MGGNNVIVWALGLASEHRLMAEIVAEALAKSVSAISAARDGAVDRDTAFSHD